MTEMKPKRPKTVGRPLGNTNRDARELLLTAATELFAEHGVAATTFAMIAKRAGMTPAMLHYYFMNREALIDAVVDERIATVIGRVWDPVKPGAEPAAMLDGIIERLVDGTISNPWIPSTWMREVLNEAGLLRGRVLKHLPFEKVRMVSDAMILGQKSGSINPGIDPVLIVFSTIGLVMLHMATLDFFAETFHRRIPGREAVCRHLSAVLLHGLEGTSSIKKGKLSAGNRQRRHS